MRFDSTSVLWQLKAASRRPRKFLENIVGLITGVIAWRKIYDSLPFPKVEGEVPVGDLGIHNVVKSQLIQEGISIKELQIDVAEFRQFIQRASYDRFPYYYDGGRDPHFFEKSLEHYLAAKLLDLSGEDTYIDVANGDSPIPQIYHDIYGCNAYAQDKYFKTSKGGMIPGNACSMPVKNGFASKIALHNSFEHFEGNDDVDFLEEANRVLQPGGRLCIIPLFLFDKFVNQTDPSVLRNCDIFDKGATIFAARGWLNRFGRHYDVPNLVSRIVQHLGELRLTIFFVTNEKDIDMSCYVKFVALFEKPSN